MLKILKKLKVPLNTRAGKWFFALVRISFVFLGMEFLADNLLLRIVIWDWESFFNGYATGLWIHRSFTLFLSKRRVEATNKVSGEIQAMSRSELKQIYPRDNLCKFVIRRAVQSVAEFRKEGSEVQVAKHLIPKQLETALCGRSLEPSKLPAWLDVEFETSKDYSSFAQDE